MWGMNACEPTWTNQTLMEWDRNRREFSCWLNRYQISMDWTPRGAQPRPSPPPLRWWNMGKVMLKWTLSQSQPLGVGMISRNLQGMFNSLFIWRAKLCYISVSWHLTGGFLCNRWSLHEFSDLEPDPERDLVIWVSETANVPWICSLHLSLHFLEFQFVNLFTILFKDMDSMETQVNQGCACFGDSKWSMLLFVCLPFALPKSRVMWYTVMRCGGKHESAVGENWLTDMISISPLESWTYYPVVSMLFPLLHDFVYLHLTDIRGTWEAREVRCVFWVRVLCSQTRLHPLSTLYLQTTNLRDSNISYLFHFGYCISPDRKSVV